MRYLVALLLALALAGCEVALNAPPGQVVFSGGTDVGGSDDSVGGDTCDNCGQDFGIVHPDASNLEEGVEDIGGSDVADIATPDSGRQDVRDTTPEEGVGDTGEDVDTDVSTSHDGGGGDACDNCDEDTGDTGHKPVDVAVPDQGAEDAGNPPDACPLNRCGLCGSEPEEICDGLDNDCDGQVDEGCQCNPALYQSIETQCGRGLCLAFGQTSCVGGQVQDNCAPGQSEAEVCNGEDDDCDDGTDEDLGQTTCGQGTCLHTVDNCVQGEEQVCDPMEGVTQEICDGLDNDCDGQVDEFLVRECHTACGAGQEVCSSGSWVGCDAPRPSVEACDGIDNNCNGETDEGVLNACGQCGEVPIEVCDGLDNDCDGGIDEGLGLGEPCVNGRGRCERPGRVICGEGGATTCNAIPGPPELESCDRRDNDCDGETDEGGVCDDADADGVLDPVDNCPLTANANQADSDHDGVGDACEGPPSIYTGPGVTIRCLDQVGNVVNQNWPVAEGWYTCLDDRARYATTTGGNPCQCRVPGVPAANPRDCVNNLPAPPVPQGSLGCNGHYTRE